MRSVLFVTLSTMAGGQVAAQLPTLERVTEIGCAMCEGPEAIGLVEAFGFGPGGTVVIGDRDPPRLRVFGVDGRLRFATARDGDGPGELRLPMGIGIRPDGSILVVDMRQLRVSTFDARGQFVTSARISTFPIALGFHPADGRVLITTTNFHEGSVVAISDDGSADTLLHPLPFPEYRFAWFASPVVRADGRFAFGEGRETYRINLYAPDGTLEREIVRDIPRTRMTPDELARRERVMAGGAARRAAEGGSGRPEVDPFRNHFTALDALAWDDRDRLWVRTMRGGPGRAIFDVFSPTGDLLGEVGVDAAIDEFRFWDGMLAGVVATEDGTQRIVLWRVRNE